MAVGCVLAAAVALTAGGLARAQVATPAKEVTATNGDPVIGIDKFDVVFRVSSQSGEEKDLRSLRLIGAAPEGLQREADGTYLLTSEDIEDHVYELGVVDGAYVAPERAKQKVRVRLKDLSYSAAAPYHASAITSIRGQTTQYLNDLGVIAVLPQLDPDQVEQVGDPAAPDYRDLRAAGNKSLKLIVQLGVVTGVRTIASGDRVPTSRRMNASEHDKIRYGSPIWPAEKSDQVERRDVLRKDLLDEYVFQLNRHPGRRVDVAVSQAEVPGGIVLDYLVSEAKPWTIYAQASNTGTAQTNEWRERFGFIHNQLTGNDDSLSLDYVTAGFDDTSTAIIGSYELPIPTFQRLRARVFGSYSQFTASDVGQASTNNFTGQQASGGAELIANVYQHHDWFGDVFAGARYEHIHTTNVTASSVGLPGDGTADVGLPYIGARLERVTDTTSLAVSSTLTYGFTGADQEELLPLGRIDPDSDWFTLEIAASYSFYLEPLLFPGRFAAQPAPGAPQPKLANEVAISARGQTAFGARLIPQHEEVVGGLYSVRGYPESVTAGDDVVIGSIEYRWHLPRALDIQPTPSQVFGRPFRVAPDRPLGRPDWDLIFKGFVDAGQATNNDRRSFEDNNTLVGTGVGLELQLKQNINLQAYWGVALTDVDGSDVQAGDNRFHFVFTVLY